MANRSDPKVLMAKLKALDLDTLDIVSDIFWKVGKAHVTLKCSVCEKEIEAQAYILQIGSIKRCKCRPIKYFDKRSIKLSKRYDGMQARCNNPISPEYKNYGGRGIKNNFSSREFFIKWMLENLPHPDYNNKIEIDRINNNGHYEPGNVRLATRMVNTCNKRNSQKVIYRGIEVVGYHLWHLLKDDEPSFPLSVRTVSRLVLEGMLPEDIMKHRRILPGGRPSNPNLKPDLAIVSLYRHIQQPGALK